MKTQRIAAIRFLHFSLRRILSSFPLWDAFHSTSEKWVALSDRITCRGFLEPFKTAFHKNMRSAASLSFSSGWILKCRKGEQSVWRAALVCTCRTLAIKDINVHRCRLQNSFATDKYTGPCQGVTSDFLPDSFIQPRQSTLCQWKTGSAPDEWCGFDERNRERRINGLCYA